MATGTNWTREECRELLKDYFEMLDLELAGEKYSKAHYRKALMRRIDRKKGSIEFKHMNVSAVLRDLGEPYIVGYKPAPHKQTMLVDLVKEELAKRGATTGTVKPKTRSPGIADKGTPKGGSAEQLVAAVNDDPAASKWALRKLRRGQKNFRENLRKLYEDRCAVTGWGPSSVLDAAHIESHAKTGINDVENGLLLRADIHSLFDDGLLVIHPDTKQIVLHKCLRSTPYWELNGTQLRSRVDGTHPGPKFLKLHYQTSFHED